MAVRAVWTFLTQFEPAITETLHAPLMSLHNALLALNENNVEPMLRPTRRTGRSPSSARRYALMGIAVGAARRLEWTGFSPTDANKEVARKLNTLGVKPTRGKGGVNADTVRRWREKIAEVQPFVRSLPQSLRTELSAEDLGWTNAAVNADGMTTDTWRRRITALGAADARHFVLQAFERSISTMALDDLAKHPS